MAAANRAPRFLTILVAAVLVVLGALATFGPVMPNDWGVWLFAAATVVMLLGIFLPGL